MIGVSLFAGIGGFDLAMHRSGIPVSAAVEIDKGCRAVLARHFPRTGLLPDVQEVTGNDIGPCDIITAGWPCQGNSVAGRRGGMADPRSGLWGEVARLLGETRPRWFVGENVPGLLTVRHGRDFGIILQSLDELGYGVAWRVLDAQFTGVPQRRRRVLIVGCLGDPAGAAEVLFERESGGGDSAPGPQAGARVAGTLAASAGGGGLGGVGQSANSITSRIVETTAYALGSHAGAADGDQTNRSHAKGGPVGSNISEEVAYALRAGRTQAVAVVSTLQGGGKRGYRVDAEGAAGGHLVCVTGGVTHTLTSEGADASEDGTGRGTPIVSIGVPQTQIAHALTTRATRATRATREQTWVTHALSSKYAVRRLTPRECERLQGFPDDWTAGQSDAARYRQLGNAVAVPVAQWLTARIAAYESTESIGAAA